MEPCWMMGKVLGAGVGDPVEQRGLGEASLWRLRKGGLTA